MSAFQRAVLSVNPDRLEQFTKEMKKNISEKKTSRRHRSPSGTSRSKARSKHSKRSKATIKSSHSTKHGESKVGSSSKSTKESRKRHHPSSDSTGTNKKLKEDSDVDAKDLDLSNPLFSLITLMKDRKALLETAFSIIQGPKLSAMLPERLRAKPLEEIRQLCGEHLNVMSSKRVVHVLAGTDMDSSSGTDSSDDEQLPGRKKQDKPPPDHTLQTNLVDSTTSDSTGPSMLFPSAISTAQSGMHDKTVVKEGTAESGDVSTLSRSAGTDITEKLSTARKSEVEEGELEAAFVNEEELHEVDDHVEQVTAMNVTSDEEEVFVEEVEEIEDAFEVDQGDAYAGQQTTVTDSSNLVSKADDYSGKTQLEILELELRARAIRSLMKAAKTGTMKSSKT